MEWIDELAEALGEEPLSAEQTTRLLSSARAVAHRVERRVTPLAAFLLGVAVGRRTAAERDLALAEVLEALEARLPSDH
ncbi:MAG TPA: DUF6457 domain-containing protein [Actinomycetota bacterium]